MSIGNEIQFTDESSGFWTEIILPLALPTTYTYAIPTQFLTRATPGCRVEVVFGKHKKYAGIIKSLLDKKPPYPTKEILNFELLRLKW